MRLVFLIMFLIAFFLPLDSHFKFFLETRKPPKIKTMEVIATAYYKPLKSQNRFFLGSYKQDVRMNGNGINFTEKKAEIGTVAADLEVFPLGTRLFIPGYGEGVIRDIGTRIKGNRVDLYMGEGMKGLKRAIEWGERTITVRVLE